MLGKRRDEIKYQSFIFIVMIACSYAIMRDVSSINNEVLAFVLPDYSMGYSSRMLIGSILNVFKSTFTRQWLYDYYVCVDAAAVVISMVFLRGFVSRAEQPERMPRLLIALVFASFPYAIPQFFNFLGGLDVYWYILSLLAIMLIDVKVMRWLIPALCVVCVAIHPAYAIAFFPAVVILLLYRAVTGEGRGAYAVIFGAAFILTAAASVYSVFFEKDFLKMTYEQGSEYMNSKLNVGSTGMEFYLFGETAVLPNGITRSDAASNIFEMIKTLRKVVVADSRSFTGILRVFVKVLPIFAAVDYVWLKALRLADNKKEKFVFFLCVIYQAAIPFAWFASTDLKRWASCCLISELVMLIWMLRKKNPNVAEAFGSLVEAAKRNPLAVTGAAMLSYLIMG